MKIDVFAHILPERYLKALREKSSHGPDFRETRNRANCELDIRLRVMDRYPDVVQVLTVSLPSLESVVSPADSIELAKIANDELAELLIKYPDKFVAAVACLPLNDIDAALEEAERAIKELKFRGVQIFSNIDGEPLDLPKFKPLWEKMAGYDLPIWIHPNTNKNHPETMFTFDYDSTLGMMQLVSSGVFLDHPDIKFISHHCGAFIPVSEGRIRWMTPVITRDNQAIKPIEHLRKFYSDTAVSGSIGNLMCGYDFYGPDRILFGTDAPLGPDFGLTLETIRSVERMAISDVEKYKIFEQNAIDLLKLRI
ncbi:amidohydrolase family protein [Chloroflexota bacterium]